MTLLFQQLMIRQPKFLPHRIDNILPMCPPLRIVNNITYSLHGLLINRNTMAPMHYYHYSHSEDFCLQSPNGKPPFSYARIPHRSMRRLSSNNSLSPMTLIPVLVQKRKNVRGQEITRPSFPKNQRNSTLQGL